jgi:hypothetical protein
VFFILLPLHLQAASQGRPVEQALLLLILATECYFQLIEKPNVRISAVYAGFLTLCLYTDPLSYLPAIGWLVFLLRFIDRTQVRRAVWFLLPATVLPPLLFLPYYIWAHPKRSPFWPSQPAAMQGSSVFVDLLQTFPGNEWITLVLLLFFCLGLAIAAWRTFRPGTAVNTKRIVLFGLLGGVVSTIVVVAFTNAWLGGSFSATQVIWAAPGAMLLLFAAIEWLVSQRTIQPMARILPVLLITLTIAGDVSFFATRRENMRAEALSVPSELPGDSCVVFVSEQLSRVLFLIFEPQLRTRECMNFFHKRIVLASHPYVRSDQQQSAESFFRGLNFFEVKRTRVGGGQIIVLEQGR